MKDQLKSYVDLLFAGAPDAEDIKQEILQNTLDRYDDLIDQGKSPEAAYRLAISGIGDINELLAPPTPTAASFIPPAPVKQEKPLWKKVLHTIAIFLYIICAIPLFVLGDMNMETIGLCGAISIAAVATALLMISSYDHKTGTSQSVQEHQVPPAAEPVKKLSSLTTGICWLAGVVLFFIVSFATSAWYITWLIFCMVPCVTGILSGFQNIRTRTAGSVVKLVLLILLLSILVAILVAGIAGGSISIGYFAFDGLPGGTEAHSGTVDAASVDSIEIRWVGGSINIQTADVEEISFEEETATASAPKLAWRLDGNTLIIAFLKESTWQFGISSAQTGKDLVINVPESWIADEITIDSVSARIRVKDITASEFSLKTVSGDCTFTDCDLGSVESESVSGNLKYTGLLSEFSVEAVSADCTLELSSHPKYISLDAVSGNMTVYLPADCGFTATVDSVSGDFTTDFAATTQNGRYVFGTGDCQITADSVSGDIRVYSN